jgi:hypothetical protein
MEVLKFTIEESKVNIGCFLLIAHTNNGKYVCSGDHWNPTHVIPYERAFDFKP